MIHSNKTFFSNMDGLRFFAFFAVFINHATSCLGYNNNNGTFLFIKTTFLGNGDMGVGFFFVLSGFLITYLLLEEQEKNGSINIKNFYLRRVLRIWPLYFFIVALALLVFPLFEKHQIAPLPIMVNVTRLNPWFYLTFTGNFDYIYNGVTNFLIGILWSISIEEQFYLFWPLIIAFIPKKKLMPTFISIIIVAIYFRFYYADGRAAMFNFHSLSCMSDLAMGAVIAYLARNQQFVERIQRIPKWTIILVYCIGFILIALRINIWKIEDGYNAYLTASFAPVIFSAFFAFIILEQNYATQSVFKMSKLKLISSWGKFTYGMYCYHIIVFFLILFFIHLTGVKIIGMGKYLWMAIVIASFFATLFLAKASYNYLESPFLKLKNKFSPSLKKSQDIPPIIETGATRRFVPVKIIFIGLILILPFIYSYHIYKKGKDLAILEANKENVKGVSYDSLIALSRENLKKYQPRKNLSLLSKAIMLNPRNSIAYMDFGATFSMLHLYGNSIDACVHALQADSTNTMAKNILNLSLAAKNKIQLSIEAQEQTNPKDRNIDFYNDYGLNYLMIGDYPKSISIWKDALQGNSFNATTLYNIGSAYMYQYKLDSALFFLKKASQLEPRNPQIHETLTWAIEERTKWEASRRR